MKSALLTGAAIAILSAGAAFAQAAGSSAPSTGAPPGAGPASTAPGKTTTPGADAPRATPSPRSATGDSTDTANPPRATPSPRADTGSSSETASTGAVNSTASSQFTVGAKVKDSTGATIGTISKLVPAAGSTPASVELKMGDDTVTIPQSSLTMQGGSIVSSTPKADVRTQRTPG